MKSWITELSVVNSVLWKMKSCVSEIKCWSFPFLKLPPCALQQQTEKTELNFKLLPIRPPQCFNGTCTTHYQTFKDNGASSRRIKVKLQQKPCKTRMHWTRSLEKEITIQRLRILVHSIFKIRLHFEPGTYPCKCPRNISQRIGPQCFKDTCTTPYQTFKDNAASSHRIKE